MSTTKHQPDRTVGGMTNGERAKKAGAALYFYARSGSYGPGCDGISTTLGDFVCDMMHFLSSMGYDPEIAMREALDNGEFHYSAETFGGDPHEGPAEPPFVSEPAVDPEFWYAQFE